LGFVEDDDVIGGRVLVPQPLVSKVMHVLDERLHGLPHDAAPRGVALAATTRDFITRERLPKRRHHRAIAREKHRALAREKHRAVAREKHCAVAREEHGMRGLRVVALPGGHVEADQCLARAWHAGHKHDDLVPALPGLVDQGLHALRCNPQIAGAGIVTGNRLHGVLRVERLRGLDDRGRGLIRRRVPGGRIERSPGRVGEAFRDEVRQAVGIAAAGRIDAVRVRNEQGRVRPRRLGGHRDRDDRDVGAQVS
jgi:hypothetical protein